MKYKAVIFDLDGTLLDSLADLADSMNTVLRKAGFPEHQLSAYRYFVGEGIWNMARKSLPEQSRDEKTVAAAYQAMMEEYSSHCTEKSRPYPGIPELLDALTAKDLKMAIFTNKAEELSREIAGRLLASWQFADFVGGRSDLPRKPNPRGARLICENLQLSPGEFLYLGDTGIDMQTASSAGMYAVGALWGFRTREELLENGAQTLIGHPQELLNLLD